MAKNRELLKTHCSMIVLYDFLTLKVTVPDTLSWAYGVLVVSKFYV